MTDEQPLYNVGLEQLCREQGQPFTWLSKGDYTKDRLLQSLKGPVTLPFRSAEVYCGRVRDVVVFGKSYVSDRPGRAVFLNQSNRNYHPQEFLDYYNREIRYAAPPHPLVTQECCFLGGFSGELKFFGHFIFEFLYRLVAFERCGALKGLPVVVFEGVPDTWLSFLELFGVPKNRILKIPQYPAPKFDRVWVASCPNFTATDGLNYALWDDGIHTLRRELREKALGTEHLGPRRVFLGRKDARHRKLINEDEVWRFLASKGFEYPDLADKSAAEQIRSVGSAEIIVSVGGSGSAMTHFAPDDCAIIEILPSHLVGGLGSFGFAAVIGQSFTRIPAEVTDHGAKLGLSNDSEVDIGRLRETVELTLQKQRPPIPI
ncbi:MAG: glycosyltransferase family 61 protein [Rhodospirillaceae bacterium]|nr:glycosyltransferase family 61 protein [Rhodospirillaceae bacterium]